MSDAVESYLESRKADLKPRSLTTLRLGLRGILQHHKRDRSLTSVTHRIAAELYAARVATRKPDTHQRELRAAGAFFAWCIRQGWLRSNPFDGIEPQGKKSARSAKLRIEESRAFLEAALGETSVEGLAAAIALLMALRATEVCELRVRDVDDGGRVLWVEGTKTENAERCLEVPERLRPALAKLCLNRSPTEPLFGDVDRHWLYYHVNRIAKAAKVPEVGTHALRRTHARISAEATSIEHVASALGHSSPNVTRRHYAGRAGEERRRNGAMLKVMQGGRR